MRTDKAHRRRTLWLVGLLHAFTHLYGVALLPLYIQVQRGLKLMSVEQATLLVTVMGVAYFVPSYFLGALADRTSRKALLTAGLITNGAGFVALALAPNYAGALGGAALAGIGGSFYHPAATALIAQLFPEARGKALGLVGIGASFGFFLGPLYTGWRAVSSGNWRTPILELGLMGIAAALLFAWLAEEKPRTEQGPARIARQGSLFPTVTLWAFFIMASLFLSLRDFGGSAMATSASLFFQKAHGFSAKLTGFALSGIFIASAVSNPLFGRLSDQGRMRWLGALLGTAALLMFLFPRVPVGFSVPVLITYGFFFMASYPVTEAALMEAVPDEVRGRVFGLFIMIGGLIGNVAHWAMGDWVGRLGGQANSVHSYYVLYATLALLVLGSMTALPFLHGIRKREDLGSGGAARPALSPFRSPEAT